MYQVNEMQSKYESLAALIGEIKTATGAPPSTKTLDLRNLPDGAHLHTHATGNFVQVPSCLGLYIPTFAIKTGREELEQFTEMEAKFETIGVATGSAFSSLPFLVHGKF